MKNVCDTGCGKWAKIIGALFLIGGTGLTILTHSDAGILGFFIAGAILAVKGSSGCSPCSGGCGACAGCCNNACGSSEIYSSAAVPVVKKVAKPRKTTKKA